MADEEANKDQEMQSEEQPEEVEEEAGQEEEAAEAEEAEQEAPFEAEEGESEPDVAEEEDLDLEIEQVTPKKRSGCGPVGWIVFIIILAVIAVYGGMRYKEQMEEQRKEARQERLSHYQTLQEQIKKDINSAAALAAEGRISDANDKLKAALEKWSNIATTANSEGDTDQANQARLRKNELQDVMKECDDLRAKAEQYRKRAAELEKKVKALEDERDEFNNKVKKMIMELGATGGGGEAEAAATAQEQAPKQKPAAKEESSREPEQ